MTVQGIEQVRSRVVPAKQGPIVFDTPSIPDARQRWPLWLRVWFWICTVIAVAAVLRRVFALANSSASGPPQLMVLDAWFRSHAGLTLTHILIALLFVVLTPLVVSRRFDRAAWPERMLFPLGAAVGITAYAMSTFAVGGWLERSAVLLFNTLFLYSLGRAFWYARHGEALRKLRWLIRAIAILLGIATTRPIMGVFFATSSLTHLEPRQFFGVAFWIGFTINALAAEAWLRSRRGAATLESIAKQIQ